MNIGEAAITAVMGYAVVFVGLILLMIVVTVMGRLMHRAKAAPAPAAAAPAAPAPAPALRVEIPSAPGTAGQVKLYNVPDKEAAMVMAIVANKMGKPLNELRFKSIKEVQ